MKPEEIRNKLALVMIVKDGAETIANALRSAAGLYGQLVIADTGSVDNTPAICASLGAELHFFEWNGSFSDARNYALGFARKEWVLVLDADEELDAGSLIGQSFLLENENIGGIKVVIDNPLGRKEGASHTRHKITRIFRKMEGIEFTGRIHEQVSPSIIDAGLVIAESDITVLHHGYIDVTDEKINRNKTLLEKELNEKPGDDWNIWHLAETEFTAGNFDAALSLYQKAVNSDALGTEQIELTKIRLAQISLSNNDPESTQRYLDFKSRDIHIEGLRKYVLAGSYVSAGRYSEALHYYKSPEIEMSFMVDKNDLMTARQALIDIYGK